MTPPSQPTPAATAPVGSTDLTYPAPTLVELLQLRAATEPDRTAYTVLVDGDDDAVSMTYGALDRRARAIAAHIQQMCEPGERILLPLPTSLEYVSAFFGCLYAGTIAVPAYPPRRNQSLDRIESMVADAQPVAALTGGASAAPLADLGSSGALRLVPLEEIDDGAAPTWTPPQVGPETVAFLQYTSGSTRTPRGVMVSHRNVLANATISAQMFELGPDDVGATWLPLYHDFGLVGGVLQPLCTGFPVVLLSPMAFLHRPIRWLRAVSRYRATLSGSPPFALDLCATRGLPDPGEHLDLSSWKSLALGGEPIRPDTLDRFVQAFEPHGFRRETLCPGYGLAEATLFFSATAPAALPTQVTVDASALERHRVEAVATPDATGKTFSGCGRPMAGQRLAIVDPDTCLPRGPDEVGEVWVAGPSIAQGYWGQPAESAAVFGARLPGDDRAYLRTGDLGFVRNGELHISGRLKDLAIVRGRNHYPQDIEWTAQQSHPALANGAGAAFSVERDGEERLVVVHEVGRTWLDGATSEVVRAIRRAVAAHHDVEIDEVVLLYPSTLPRTSSGKVRRRATADALQAGTLRRWTGPVARAAGASRA